MHNLELYSTLGFQRLHPEIFAWHETDAAKDFEKNQIRKSAPLFQILPLLVRLFFLYMIVQLHILACVELYVIFCHTCTHLLSKEHSPIHNYQRVWVYPVWFIRYSIGHQPAPQPLELIGLFGLSSLLLSVLALKKTFDSQH